MPIYRKSKFTEHIDDVHPSELKTMSQPRTTEAYHPIPTSPMSGSWSPLLPHQHPKPSSSKPSTTPPSSTPSHKSSTTPASTSRTDSPTPLNTHPLPPSPQTPATSFIFHSPTHTISTSHLFESHPASPFLLTTVLHILNGEGAIADLAAVENYRSTLPIYAAYSGLDPDFEWMDRVDEGEGKWLDAWLSNQQAWEGCENGVLHGEWDMYGGEKSYAEILRGVYGPCEDGRSGGFGDLGGDVGVDVGESGGGGAGGLEEDRFEYEERHVSDDDMAFGCGESRGRREDGDGEDCEERRGRSRTGRRATAARRGFGEGDVW